MIRRLSVFLLAVVAMLTVVNVVCQAQPQTLLTRHVRDAVVNGEAKPVGQLPATQSMHFDIVLALRHAPELENFLQDVYDPTSPNYRHFVTPKEFTARFGPSQEDYDALIQFAKANGFQVMRGSRDGRAVQLKGTVGAIEKAFHVTMGVYQHPYENRTFYAPDREPTVDLPFQLWAITGLDNYSIPRPLVQHRDSREGPQARQGSCPGGYYCGSDMRAAYYGGSALTGTGQNIALLELAGTTLSDLSLYYKNANQTQPYTPTLVSTGGYSTSCTGSCDDAEQTLDMTQAMGMAPGSTMLYNFVCGDAYNTGTFDETACLSSMVSTAQAPLSLQISCSWSWTPADPQTDDPYYQQMAAQGQSFFAASGDSAKWVSGGFVYPQEDAFIISVGGTDLLTNGAGGGWQSETAWSSSGGGISPDHIAIPSWQQLPGVINSQNKGSTQYRNGPDVAAEANFDFYVCHKGSCGGGWGGTSFAAPMFAGYLALANQQAVANGVPAPGFINPTIYPLGLSGGYAAAFHDITSGSNGFPAVTGYDLVTGWGSPNGPGLIDALTQPQGPSFTLTANPNALTIVQGSSGTSTITVNPLNGFNGSVTLSASGLPSGVTAGFSPNPTSTTSTLTLTVGSGAALGTSTITISGVSGSLSAQTTIQLTVTGTGTTVTLTPSSLTFANTVVGGTSAPKTATLTNTGTSTLNINSIAASGDFAVSSTTCGATLAAGKFCKIKVTFKPTQLGSRTGTLSVSDNGQGSPQTVALSGTGIAPVTLTPASKTFPATKVGATSAAKTFTLHNKQAVSLTGISISTTGDFSVSATACGASLAAKSNCTISVVFKPTQTGTRTGTLQVSNSAFGSPETSSLTGTGK
ncbi:MAG: choice-of-anchor D domain-containing protein [Terriglobales bacterium]